MTSFVVYLLILCCLLLSPIYICFELKSYKLSFESFRCRFLFGFVSVWFMFSPFSHANGDKLSCMAMTVVDYTNQTKSVFEDLSSVFLFWNRSLLKKRAVRSIEIRRLVELFTRLDFKQQIMKVMKYSQLGIALVTHRAAVNIYETGTQR